MKNNEGTPTYHELRAERLKKAMSRPDVSSVSSNSKWYKVFSDLEVLLDRETTSEVKLLQQKEAFEYQSLLSSCFEPTYLDGMSGPLRYSEIEWLKIFTSTPLEFDFQVDFEEFEGYKVIYGYRVSKT